MDSDATRSANATPSARRLRRSDVARRRANSASASSRAAASASVARRRAAPNRGGAPAAPAAAGPEDGDSAPASCASCASRSSSSASRVLAFVSWIFGIMMAVAQDLPAAREPRAVQARRELGRLRHQRQQARHPDQQPGPDPASTPSEIAPVMKEAVVAIEDQRFYEHRGVDFQGIAPRRLSRTSSPARPSRAPRRSPSSSSRTRSRAQDSRTVFQKLREAALAYHLERQWSKDKILTEYLNEIYFGEGAYGIEAAARTYFGCNHPGCGEGDAADRCASQLLPWEAAMLAGIISSPSAYSTREPTPRTPTARRNLVLQNMADAGLHHRGGVRHVLAASPLPTPEQIQPPAEDSAAPYFTSWLRQQLVDSTAPARRSAAGSRSTRRSTSSSRSRSRAIVADRARRGRPTASVVVLDNETGGVRAMVGGYDYQEQPVQPGHQRPPPARLGVQAVHAGDRARAGPLDRRGLRLGAAGDPVPGAGSRARTARPGGHRALRGQQLRGLATSASASLATATTYSDNSVYAQLGTPGRAREHRRDRRARWASRPTSRPTTEYSIDGRPVRALQPGADPRRPRDGRHPAGDGARLQDARGTTASASRGTMAALARRPGRDRRGQRRADHGRAASWSRTRHGDQRRQRGRYRSR